MHGHAYSVAVKKTEDYKALYMYYEQMYLKPVRKYDAANVPETVEVEAATGVVPEAEPVAEAVAETAVTLEKAEKTQGKKKNKHKK